MMQKPLGQFRKVNKIHNITNTLEQPISAVINFSANQSRPMSSMCEGQEVRERERERERKRKAEEKSWTEVLEQPAIRMYVYGKYHGEPDEVPQTAGPQQQESSHCSPPRKKYERCKHKCLICGELYADIVQHLRSTEKVVNKTELSLLSKFSHRHFRTNLDCPVRFCQSKYINRLDKHLQRVHSLKNPMVKLYIQKAKDRYIARELALLRASKPTPPMVSHLDEVDDAAIEEGVRRVIEAASHAAASAIVPPLSGPMSSSPLASQGSCDPKTKTMQDPSPSTSQASFDQQAKRRRRRSVLRAPDPGCRNCQLLSAELKVVKNLLQIEIERNDELKQLHSSTMRATAVKHRRRAPFPPSKAPRYVRLVEEFRGHTEGANPSRKTSENAKQRAKHVRDFLEYMAGSSIPNIGLLFLSNHARIRGFVADLQEKGFKPPTQRNYLMDAVSFMKYISNMAPPSVRLGTKKINAILVELRARIRDIGRDVVGHQLSVRRSKSVDLEKHPEDRACLKEFFGLLGGYIIATTGHRKGVVINMTTKEVKAAEKTKQGARIIRVGQHKSQRYFGEAAVPLKPSEYSWLQRYNLLRNRIEGGKEASTFFHTTSGGILLKLSEYFKEAWEGMGLGTAPTFNMLRSSVATYAKRQLGHKTYQKVATFMCHDANTAKRFYQAEDPAEVTLQCRGLSMMAISTYAAKTRKRREKHKKDNTMTIASSEDEREDNEPTQNEDNQGFVEEEQEPLGQEKSVRKRLNQLHSNKILVPSDQQMVSSSDEDDAGDMKTTLTETVPDPDEEHVPKRTYQLREKRASVPLNQQMTVTSFKEDGTDKREVEFPFQKRENFSSSEGDGSADEWKPTQQESENDSEEEEKEVLQRVHKVAKRKRSKRAVLQREEKSEGDSEEEDEQIIGRVHKVAKRKRSESPVPQRELRSSSEVERVGSRVRALRVTEKESEEECTRGESPCLPEKEGEALSKGNMGESGEEDVLQNETQQAFVNPGTAKTLTTHSTKTVCDRGNMVNKMIFHQSSFSEVIMPISGDNIEHQAGSTVGQMIPSGSMGETVSKEWLLENEVSVGDTTLHKSLPEERPRDYEGQEKEGEVDEGYLEMSKTEGEDRNKTEDKLKEGQKTEKETQEETLEKMDSDGEEGQKAEEKIHSDGGEGQKTDEKRQEETLEKMESKSEKGKKRETKIQEKTLEKMESKSEKGKKRETKIQEKTLEKMESKSEKGKKRETKIQEKTLEKMEGKSEKGKKRQTKIQEKSLEKMESKSEKRKKRREEHDILEKRMDFGIADSSDEGFFYNMHGVLLPLFGPSRELRSLSKVERVGSRVRPLRVIEKESEEECTRGESPNLPEKEEEALSKGNMGESGEEGLLQNEMPQAFVSPETAKILSTHSRKTVCDQVNMVNEMIFHQSSLFEVIMPISGDNIKHQAGSTVGQMIPSGSMGETVSKEWLLENEVSVGDTTLHKSLPEERPGDYEGQEKEGEVDEGNLEMSKIEGEDRNKTEDKIKGQKTEKETQGETLEKMDSDGEEGQKAEEKSHSDGGEGQKTDEKRQEETLEKMESKSEKGKKRETKIQEKTLEKMESKSEKGKKRETKIQEKTLENMEGKSERGKKRETKIQEKTLEKMEGKSEKEKKRETKIQEKTLENMEGKTERGKKRETKIQEKTLENMEGKTEKGKKRETKIQEKTLENMEGKTERGKKRETKIQEKTLENMEGKSERGKKRETKIQEKTLENMEGKTERGKKRETKIQEKTLENMEGKSEKGKKRETKIQEKTLENMEGKSEKGKKRETKIQEKTLENMEGKSEKGKKRQTKIQEKTLEKMENKSEKGKKRETKIQEKTLENMEGKSERGKKRETKIQEKTLENMEGKTERGKKRETKIQEKTLENMEGKNEKGKKRETKIQEKTLENMEGKSEKGKKRQTKIEEKTLEKMESKSEKGKKRETKIQDEPVVMTRSKVKELQKRKIEEEHLEKSERESGEGSSGAAQTWKMPLKRRKFQ
ncbi:hypothetical protein ABVT39_010294 [Epinephelus coioides]